MKINRTKAISDLAEMLRIRTVSREEGSGIETDKEAFRTFRAFIKKQFPILFEVGEGWQVGDYGCLIRIPGRSAGAPSVLMAHMDVVDADPEEWDFDPFAGTVTEEKIIGRGALDTKSTLCSILTAMDARLRDGFVPKHDIWLSFGGEEETCGTCCSEIVDHLRSLGVKPAFVLDEGGSVIPEGLPGVKKPAAMIGIAEKGTANFMLSIQREGSGHASVPPRHTVIGRLAKAACRIENHPFPARMTGPVYQMFRSLEHEVPFFEKPVFRHPEVLGPAIAAAATVLGGTFNAMVRSTAAVTIISSGSEYNVLPDRAALGVNVRLLPGDTIEYAKSYFEKVIDDPEIRVDVIAGTEASDIARTDCPEYRLLEDVIKKNWPGVITAPYQMNGGTDSRFYSELTDRIYRFSPMVMTKEERAMVHGRNEAILIKTYLKMIRFYSMLIEQL